MEADAEQSEYEKHAQERTALTEVILNSDARKKLILAGPGTGKSFLFQQICKEKVGAGGGKILALSFINELVDDLSRDLHQLAEVKTLHSFALNRIPGDKNMFIRLGSVIERDYAIAFGNRVSRLCSIHDRAKATIPSVLR